MSKVYAVVNLKNGFAFLFDNDNYSWPMVQGMAAAMLIVAVFLQSSQPKKYYFSISGVLFWQAFQYFSYPFSKKYT
jgi:hypothetical protein